MDKGQMDYLIYGYEPEVFESEFLIVVIAMEVISSSSDIGDHILASIRRWPNTNTATTGDEEG